MNQGLIDRVGKLWAMITEHHDVELDAPMVVTIVCNGCGRTQTMQGFVDEGFVEVFERMLDGWRLGGWREEQDFCPDCAGHA